MQTEEYELYRPSEEKNRLCPYGHSGATFVILRKRERITGDPPTAAQWFYCPICTAPYYRIPETVEEAIRYKEYRDRREAAAAAVLNQYERRVHNTMKRLMKKVNRKLFREMKRLAQAAK